MVLPSATAERPLPTNAGTPAVLDVAVATRRVAGDAVRLVAENPCRRRSRPPASPVPTGARQEGQRVHPAEEARRAALGLLTGPRRPRQGLPVVVGPSTLAATAAASSAVVPALIALRHVVVASTVVLAAPRTGSTFPGNVLTRMEAIASAAYVRAEALRRRPLGPVVGPSPAAVQVATASR